MKRVLFLALLIASTGLGVSSTSDNHPDEVTMELVFEIKAMTVALKAETMLITAIPDGPNKKWKLIFHKTGIEDHTHLFAVSEENLMATCITFNCETVGYDHYHKYQYYAATGNYNEVIGSPFTCIQPE